MPDSAATGRRPSPRAAYEQWIAACASAGWRAMPAAQEVPIASGLGRVTAEQVRARYPAPRSACAAMDGIAIRAGGIPSPADAIGQWLVDASSFAWVDTGDPLPDGMDTVVERERVRIDAGGSAWVTGPAARGLHVRAAGEDFQAGQLLIGAGHRLRPADLATAAAAGHVTLRLTRQPVAAIIPTGDEIRPIGSALRPGEITDSNSLLLASRAAQAGALPLVSPVQPDDQAGILAEVRRAALGADIVLVIAGSSAGRSDYTAAVIDAAGGLAVRGVAVRPGHPVLLGYAGAGQATATDRSLRIVPVVGVPGYPLAAAVIFELFAIPMLAALQGEHLSEPVWQRVQLASDWTSSPDVEDWVLVSLTSDPASTAADGTVLALPVRRGAGAISRLMRANAWWPIPIGQAKFVRGDVIDVQPISGAPA